MFPREEPIFILQMCSTQSVTYRIIILALQMFAKTRQDPYWKLSQITFDCVQAVQVTHFKIAV